jgi:hypothetical protein
VGRELDQLAAGKVDGAGMGGDPNRVAEGAASENLCMQCDDCNDVLTQQAVGEVNRGGPDL